MSLGHYNYGYRRVEELADEIEQQKSLSPLRAVFVAHLRLVAIALHDIEGVDSYDLSPGAEDAAIRAVLSQKIAEI